MDILDYLIVPYIQINNCEDKNDIWNYAARIGSLPLIRMLHNHNVPGCTIDAMDLAAQNGHLNVVQFLHYN